MADTTILGAEPCLGWLSLVPLLGLLALFALVVWLLVKYSWSR